MVVAAGPDRRKKEAQCASHKENGTPAEGPDDPEKQRAQKRQSKILTDGIRAVGTCSLVLWKPGGQHAAVRRETRRLGNTQPESAGDQARKAGHQALCQCKRRPDRDGQEVGKTGTDAVQHDTARYLCGSV
jgi:hypothetical protein